MRIVQYVFPADAQTTLPGVLERRAEMTPNSRFVTCEGESVTFGDFQERALRAAAALAYTGVQAGDRVALMMGNSLEFLDVFFGTVSLGAIAVPINTGLRGEGLRYVVEHAGPRVLICDGELTTACDEALADARMPENCFALGGARDGWQGAEEWLTASHPAARRPRIEPGDPASLLYTSGTTGRPKGAVNCHNVYGVSGNEFARVHVGARADDVFYTTLPLFHVNAQLLSTMGSLVSGLPLGLARRFSASGFLAELRQQGATVFNYIGAMLTMISKQPEREDDSDNPARIAIGGAAPADLWLAFERRFGVAIREIYGLTETGCYCVGSPPDEPRVGKIGRPVSWAEVRIAAEDDTDAGAGTPGEILVRSHRPDVLFKGYFKDPEATAESMRGGWFHTGDRGQQDEDGYLVFLDRLKDVIRRRGENISSYEVERVLNAHDSVLESAVVGVPSELGEEDVLAVVVLKPDHTLEASDLIAYCEGRIGRFMVPRYVRFFDELPKTATQRVQKYKLREEAIGPDTWDRETARSRD